MSIVYLLEHNTHTFIAETYTFMVLCVVVLGLGFLHIQWQLNTLWKISYSIYR